jgi:transcription elongation factor Elf1
VRAYLVNCPRCGAEVVNPVKTWPIPSRKTGKSEDSKLMVGIFDCSSCGARFRAAVEVQTEVEEKTDISGMVEKIKGIKGELMQTLMNLREKISTLETERAGLMVEIEKLRKVAEARVNALESEVTMLREEARSLRDLLGYVGEPEEQ